LKSCRYFIGCLRNELISIKFWINGKDEFKSTYQTIPSLSNSDTLLKDVSKIIESKIPVVIVRNYSGDILSDFTFDYQIEEEKPFLSKLYSDFQLLLKKNSIHINNIDHQNYRERYLFIRGDEKAIVDFEYNGDGFFGRAIAVDNKCNSIKLLEDIKSNIIKLKL